MISSFIFKQYYIKTYLLLQLFLASSLLVISSCGSTKEFKKRTFQKEAKEIAKLSFVNKTRFTKRDHIWVVDSTHNKLSLYTLVPTEGREYKGKMPIEVHIKDSLLRKELITPKNIVYFKKQLKPNEYNLLSKSLLEHPKVKIVPEDERPGGSFFHGDVYAIKSIMFTKDMKYAILYTDKANSFSAISIYRKVNNKWENYRSFVLGF